MPGFGVRGAEEGFEGGAADELEIKIIYNGWEERLYIFVLRKR